MKLRDVLNRLMELEERVATLYGRFYLLFRSYARLGDCWWEMALDEHGHVGLLKMLHQAADPDREAGVLEEQLRALTRMVEQCEREASGAVPVERALDIAIRLETSELEPTCNQLLQTLRKDLPALAAKAFTPHHAHLKRLVTAVSKFGDEDLRRRVGEIRQIVDRPRRR